MIEIVSTGGRKYIAGLFWQPAAAERRSEVFAEAKGKASQMNATLDEGEPPYDAYAVLKGDQGTQFGIGGLEGKPRALGAPSLAASIVEAVPSSNWRGWFVLEDGVWVVAVVQGIILAQGDFLGPDSQAEHTWNYLDSLSYDWDESSIRTFSPQESHSELQWLLTGKPQAELQPLKKRILPRGSLWVVSFAIIASVAGSYIYSEMQEAERLRQELIAQKAALENPQSISDLFPHEWVGEPQAGDVFLTCLNGIEATPLREVGWDVESVTCRTEAQNVNEVSIAVTWKRSSHGTFRITPMGASIDPAKPNYTSAVMSIPLEAKAQPDRNVLLTREDMTRVLLEAARPYEAHIEIDWAAVQTKAMGSGENRENIPSPWRKGEFTVRGMKMRPDRFAEHVATWPGVVLDTISITPHGRWVDWEVKGSVYVQSG